MFLITCLGNPGQEYEKTPHNAGFLFADTLREYLKRKDFEVSDWENEDRMFSSQICKVRSNGEVIAILQKPLTFMNRSGIAVKSIYSKFDIDEFILVHDDLDILLGKYKIQREKSPKGHNGIKSVEDSLGTTDFRRVRVGIEHRQEDMDIPGEDYVLMRYSDKEMEDLRFAIQEGVEELVNDLFEL
jgi:PTH1 family peptidyl-tRNA hydrolase